MIWRILHLGYSRYKDNAIGDFFRQKVNLVYSNKLRFAEQISLKNEITFEAA